jgi:hypothetical protein
MDKLQQLLNDRWPISNPAMRPTTRQGRERMRKIFTEGYEAATSAGAELIKYDNTLFYSIENEWNGEGIRNDFMLEGSAERLGAGLAAQMERHPELVEFLEYSLTLYDNLMRINAHEEANK